MSVRALLLALVLGTALPLLRAEDQQQDAQSGEVESVVKQVRSASDAQDARSKAVGPVKVHMIREAPEADLANGDGDIDTTGECSTEVEHMCSKVLPGDGRLAKCLMGRMKDEAKGNTTGRRVSGECKRAVSAFYSDRSKNVNKNLALAMACMTDIEKYCKDLPNKGAPGAVLACLRRERKKLRPTCKDRVVGAMISAANDFRADPGLEKVCAEEAERLCPDVPHGEGRTQACLRSKLQEVNEECQEELSRQEWEGADDIRLSAKLLNACRSDQARFCDGVPPGANRVKDCLEEHRTERRFSAECRAEIEDMMALRAADFRLDPALRDACSRDIEETCGYAEGGLDKIRGFDARVIQCLQDFKSQLKVPECVAAVNRGIQLASEDIRFDERLADACYADREQHCPDHVPGSARVIRCLQDHREQLSYECRTGMFMYEVNLAESIDFQWPLKQACATEVLDLCDGVPHGHARVIRCLQTHVDDQSMGKECRRELRRNMRRMAEDYRLNWRLAKTCEADRKELCPSSCPPNSVVACGGTVLRCLQEHLDKLQSSDCREEVFYFIKMEVSDFRNDVLLAEACRSDVGALCADVDPGEGRVLDCLRSHRPELSPDCHAEETKLSQLQATDVRLRPKLMKLCGEEMVAFCHNVKPGGGRMFNCLLENTGKPEFGSACKGEVVKREDMAKSDYRYDAGVASACAGDIAVLCAVEAGGAHGHAEVLRCLADRMVDPASEVTEQCEVQMSRAVRMAFWDYRSGSALTLPCDTDVVAACSASANKSRGVFTIGAVGRCLTKQLAGGEPLSPGCRKLVSVAAPKDVRTYLQGRINSDGTLRSETGTLQAVVSRAHAATSGITLTGSVALLSVAASCVLVVLAAVWLYRRYAGIDRPNTQFVAKGRGGAEPPLAEQGD